LLTVTVTFEAVYAKPFVAASACAADVIEAYPVVV